MDSMESIRETFFQECDEQLGELEAGLLAMQDGNTATETVDAVFRAVHSIKGGAGAFKLDQLVRFAHTFETTLDLIRNGLLAPTPAVLKTMLRAVDVLSDLVKAARSGEVVDKTRTGALEAELSACSSGEQQAAVAEPASKVAEEVDIAPFDAAWSGEAIDFQPLTLSLDLPDLSSCEAEDKPSTYQIFLRPHADLFRKGNEVTRLLRELSRLGTISVACDHSQVPNLPDLDPEGVCLSWSIELVTNQDIAAIREVFEFVDGDCELEIRPEPATHPLSNQTTATENGPGASEPICFAAAAAEIIARKSSGEPATIAPKPVVDGSINGQPGPAKADAAAATGAIATTIRVDLERVDRLINLVGELVINQAMLSQRVIEAGVARSSSVAAGLDELEQLTREIQEGVMAIRAQPVKPLFQRMTRIVREVADATGKAVRLKTDGEGTEVDRTVIERLADPLTHMIRNAVDHGLELPEARLAAGKPAMGEVRLSAAHRSGRIAIEITDDGAGINRSRVKSIAIKKGLIPPDAQLSDNEIDNLIFLPGFSTAETISSISGRGVGMDVVRRSIQALGGRISISSRPGRGSTFSLSLPLTLAVLDGMIVKVADQTLVVPLTAIVETLKPKASDVHGLGVDTRVIANRGRFIPLIDVGRELHYRTHQADPLTGVALLVESEGGARSALMVDAIQDQRQVVIKSLETNYGHVPGVAAATILGDGRIALILDVDTIVAKSSRSDVNSKPLQTAAGF